MSAVIALLLRAFGEPHRRHLLILLGSAVGVVLLGSGLFALAEDLPYATALYWAVTTATTVGYGDITPHNPAGRLIASLVMLTSIPLLAAAFAIVSGAAAAAGIRRVLNMRTSFPEGTYRLIVGMSPTVPAILDELTGAGIPVVHVADVDPAAARSGVHVVRGNPTDEAVIARARPAGAQQALITGTSDGDVLVSAVLLRKQALARCSPSWSASGTRSRKWRRAPPPSAGRSARSGPSAWGWCSAWSGTGSSASGSPTTRSSRPATGCWWRRPAGRRSCTLAPSGRLTSARAGASRAAHSRPALL